jgi:hypothetical protein
MEKDELELLVAAILVAGSMAGHEGMGTTTALSRMEKILKALYAKGGLEGLAAEARK